MAKEADSFRKLCVIDRLKVGPVRLNRDRLTAQYELQRGRDRQSTELVYRYEEPVFDPDDVDCLNLGSVIAAQVAVNYGLFCSEIEFAGPYSSHDRRFLREMARNTAREIFVNKFLMPNPFLTTNVSGLPAEKPDEWLRSELIFSGGDRDEKNQYTERTEWNPDKSRHAVLSSGGKDSLLTYGLLNEMGREVHPVFLNESGRHWYTALNAYRHFREHVPGTSRVWTNADRVFSWFLRNMGFIRKDFARIRSDEYPVRLWTVAVFLFGALPVLKKRSIGRLLIGDEFDTTIRPSFRGISHYGALYDQSRYFDNALTRYFARKGYGISQFSILRPMSEMLIQKTLVERYPELQKHQVSCHAAHIDGERALPCGRCEKCRRIVGMLTALDADARACGYSGKQIRDCLEALSSQGIHQEASGSDHMYSLLIKKGFVGEKSGAKKSGRSHPEILKLRFDMEKSPVNSIPVDLRESLYKILLAHAAGAVRRNGRVWLKYDPLSGKSLLVPYRFERADAAGVSSDTDRGDPADQYELGGMTWPEAEERFREIDIALLPVGSTEQHGPHLPLDVDAYDANRLCLEVAAACSLPRPIVLPLVSYGVSYHHEDFAGTISVAPGTLSQYVYEIGMSVSRHGITKLIIVNGHGGNIPALRFAAQMINSDARIFTCVDTGETSDVEIEEIIQTRNDVHAGEIETSTALAFRPGVVKMELARRRVPKFSSEYLEFSSKKGVEWYVRTARISRDGVMGDPTKATVEKGKKIWEIMIRNLVALVEDIKCLTLDEIYQRKY